MNILAIILMLGWSAIEWAVEWVWGHFKIVCFFVALLIVSFLLLHNHHHSGISITEGHNMHAALSAFLLAIAIGTLWGWVILAAAVIIIIAFVENDKGFWAFTVTAATFILLFDLPHALLYVVHHPLYVLGWVALYFTGGTVYGIFKWTSFVHDKMADYKERKSAWMDAKGIKAIDTPELALAFRNSNGFTEPPKVRNHKGDILMWMTYWPFSGLWTLINDPVRKFFRFLYNQISGTLQSISNRIFKDASADMALAKQGEEAELKKAKEEQEKKDAERAAQRGPRSVKDWNGQ